MITAATSVAASGGLSQAGIREGIETKIRIRRALGDFPFSEPKAAQLLFLALILDEDPAARQNQLEGLGTSRDEVAPLYRKSEDLSISDRFAIMELCCSGLRKVCDSDIESLLGKLRSLASQDQKISLKEALILKVVRSQIQVGSSRHSSEKGGRTKHLNKISPQVADLLHLVATLSAEDEEEDDGTEDGPPPPTPVPPRPDIITLGVTPQDAVLLTWAVEARLPLTLALRSATDTNQVPTEPVTLDYFMDTYRITVPGKREYTIEPALRSIRQLDLSSSTISIGGDAGGGAEDGG